MANLATAIDSFINKLHGLTKTEMFYRDIITANRVIIGVYKMETELSWRMITIVVKPCRKYKIGDIVRGTANITSSLVVLGNVFSPENGMEAIKSDGTLRYRCK